MVCEKCTTKLSKLATIRKDHGGSKVTNENKLLTSKQKFKADRDQYKKCRICGHLTHHVHSHYCQPCAYQKGICAMCGRKVIETKNYKQTAV